MKIALFGGTFDPPHLAHTKLVDAVLEQGLFDQVWYVPVAIHQQQFIKDSMLDVQHRLAMLDLVLVENTRVEKFEINSNQPSHTHTTLRALQEKFPEHQFCFLMGSDQLQKLELWNCEQDVACFPRAADEFEYYIYPRAGYPLDLPFSNLKIIEEVEPIDLSSTDIREMLAAGKSIENVVATAVYEYIQKNNLY
jgi:nicotinate-nucleotide adenylyltransferase